MWLTMIFVQALPCLLGAAPTINVAEIPAFQVPASDSHRSDYGSHRLQPSVIVFTTPPASSGLVTSSCAASIKEDPQDFFTSGHGEAINSMWLTMIFVQALPCLLGAAPTINVAEIPAFQVPASDSHRSDYGSHRLQPSVIVFTTPPASSGLVTSSCAASIKEDPQDFFTSGHGEAINSMWLTMIFVQCASE
ncbi:uncharacterized protein LOC121835041 [Ixodes scapularis]|uniref:uncharacterized protein LOC121835041 n=1 Tax=Ixodes scapularis TaxID=6945 RepID=UPI001A9D793C|nr:uncharacterized protein LOC121835041 [Ixodes scapularis]